MYKLYTDKSEIFECEVSVKNASFRNSIARLIVESSDGLDLVFKGKIQDGKCTVPIKKLKGLLDESSKGNMHLEIIVEDTYFKPWSDEFTVEEHTAVKVTVKEQKETSSKPILEVKIAQPKKEQKLPLPVTELIKLCEKFDITSKNYKNKKRNDFKQLVKEYFTYNKEFHKKMNPILNKVITSLK